MNEKTKLLARLRSMPAATRVTLIYAVFAALWITTSGMLLTFTIQDPDLQGHIELIKGLMFVAVTSGLLYLLLKD